MTQRRCGVHYQAACAGLVATSAALLVAGCEEPRASAPVDTTLPEPRPATLAGEMSYPSDYIPKDMRICAESLDSGQTYCRSGIVERAGRRLYRLSVPAGRYHVYAETAELPDYRAFYTDAVVCGLKVECRSHAPITVTVHSGETRAKVDPGDWYAISSNAEPKLDRS